MNEIILICIIFILAGVIFVITKCHNTEVECMQGFLDSAIPKVKELQFKIDELLMDNQLLANKVQRLENSNAQLQRRPRA